MIYRFLQHSGWTGLHFTSRSHDQGADIVGWDPSGNLVVVQCKHTRSNSVGKKGVEDLRRGCEHYDTPYGILVTNAPHAEPAAHRRIQELSGAFEFLLWTGGDLVNTPLPEISKSRKEPRDYQSSAIEDALDAILGKGSKAQVHFATGLGKSIVLAEVARYFLEKDAKCKVLLLAEQTTLISQLESDMWPQLSANISTRVWGGKKHNQIPTDFTGLTVAMRQSILPIIRKNIELLPEFDLIMIDECHHAMSPTFLEVINSLNAPKLFGVTATPWRGDGKQLKEIFGEAVATMGIVEGIRRGFLSDLNYNMMIDDIDWSVVNDNTEHYTVKSLNSKLFVPTRDEEMCGKIISKWRDKGEPKTITFCRSKEHAKRLQGILNSMGMPSQYIVSGESTGFEQGKTMTQFRAGKFSNLISVDMINEGVDLPDVSMVIFARVTQSRRIFIQQLGRGLRINPDNPKGKTEVLDFVADIRQIASGLILNQQDRKYRRVSIEEYRENDVSIVNFSSTIEDKFVEQYLKDVADLEEDDKVKLDFIHPTNG